MGNEYKKPTRKKVHISNIGCVYRKDHVKKKSLCVIWTLSENDIATTRFAEAPNLWWVLSVRRYQWFTVSIVFMVVKQIDFQSQFMIFPLLFI